MNVGVKTGGRKPRVLGSAGQTKRHYTARLSGQRMPVNSACAGRSAQSPPGGGAEDSGGGKRYFRLTSVVLIQENLTN